MNTWLQQTILKVPLGFYCKIYIRWTYLVFHTNLLKMIEKRNLKPWLKNFINLRVIKKSSIRKFVNVCSEAYLRPYQTYMTEHFCENGFRPLTIFFSITDVWWGSKHDQDIFEETVKRLEILSTKFRIGAKKLFYEFFYRYFSRVLLLFLGTPILRNTIEWLFPFISIERLYKGVHIS